MKIMLDTNIVIDVLLNRKEFFTNSYEIMKLSTLDDFDLYISASAITDIHYIVRKQSGSHTIARDSILKLNGLVCITDTVPGDIMQALAFNMSDFEDAVVSAVANRIKADCIVTRNKKDFTGSPLPVMSPTEFLKEYGPNSN